MQILFFLSPISSLNLSSPTSTIPEKKREKIPESTVFLGFYRGHGRKGKDLKEKRKEEAEEKSLTGISSKALITAYFLVLSGKIKICGEEKLVLQEHIRYSNSASFLQALNIFV